MCLESATSQLSTCQKRSLKAKANHTLEISFRIKHQTGARVHWHGQSCSNRYGYAHGRGFPSCCLYLGAGVRYRGVLLWVAAPVRALEREIKRKRETVLPGKDTLDVPGRCSNEIQLSDWKEKGQKGVISTKNALSAAELQSQGIQTKMGGRVRDCAMRDWTGEERVGSVWRV